MMFESVDISGFGQDVSKIIFTINVMGQLFQLPHTHVLNEKKLPHASYVGWPQALMHSG
jgi:hypothetical protein